jgi:hypothetical protein
LVVGVRFCSLKIRILGHKKQTQDDRTTTDIQANRLSLLCIVAAFAFSTVAGPRASRAATLWWLASASGHSPTKSSVSFCSVVILHQCQRLGILPNALFAVTIRGQPHFVRSDDVRVLEPSFFVVTPMAGLSLSTFSIMAISVQ